LCSLAALPLAALRRLLQHAQRDKARQWLGIKPEVNRPGIVTQSTCSSDSPCVRKTEFSARVMHFFAGLLLQVVSHVPASATRQVLDEASAAAIAFADLCSVRKHFIGQLRNSLVEFIGEVDATACKAAWFVR
jgi:hypothetical protein